jgi:hypothetical protein
MFILNINYLCGGSIPLASSLPKAGIPLTPSWVCPGERSLFNYHRLAGHTREPRCLVKNYQNFFINLLIFLK